jgi:hypothetical protein
MSTESQRCTFPVYSGVCGKSTISGTKYCNATCPTEHGCVYVYTQGRNKGETCCMPIVPGTEFCSQCPRKIGYKLQQSPLFRRAFKEWGLVVLKEGLYLSTKYEFMLSYVGSQFHLECVSPRPDCETDFIVHVDNDNKIVDAEVKVNRSINYPIYRPPTDKEKEIARQLGIIVN